MTALTTHHSPPSSLLITPEIHFHQQPEAYAVVSIRTEEDKQAGRRTLRVDDRDGLRMSAVTERGPAAAAGGLLDHWRVPPTHAHQPAAAPRVPPAPPPLTRHKALPQVRTGRRVPSSRAVRHCRPAQAADNEPERKQHD